MLFASGRDVPSSLPDELLHCPTCHRDIVIDVLDRRSVGVRVTRCPYPSCAKAVVALTTWYEIHPREVYSPREVASKFRWRLVDDAPKFFVAESILALAITASGYAIHHVAVTTADQVADYLTRVGIVVGAIGLAVPATSAAIFLAQCLVRRVLDDRRVLRRVELGLPIEPDRFTDPGFRLAPAPRSYR